MRLQRHLLGDVPSGRPKVGYREGDDSATVCDILHDELVALKRGGKRLDLLLNANCYGAEAMSKKLEAHVIDILATLVSWGTKPEIVTTASPFIARTLKKVFPEIEVRASVDMRLMTVQAMAYLAPWFDSYYLGRDVQRNLDTVKRAFEWGTRGDDLARGLFGLIPCASRSSMRRRGFRCRCIRTRRPAK